MNHSLNQYYIFYTVAKCSNFTLASRQLFISQPAVSKAVARLEEELGTALFYRLNKGVKLTESGMTLFRHLESAFCSIESAEEQIRRNEEAGKGQLSIGVSNTLCKCILLPYLKKFLSLYPNIRISISCKSSYETIDLLKNGTLDLGLVGETNRLESLSFLPLLQIHDIFACTRQYLSSVSPSFEEADNTFDSFSRSTLLLLNQGNVTRQYIDRYLLQNQISSERIIEVSSMDLLIDFAKTGLGIACVIKEFVETELSDGSLICLRTKESVPVRNVGYAFSSSAGTNYAVARFLEGIPSDK